MRRLTRVLILLATVTVPVSQAPGEELDAVTLAGQIDRLIEQRLEAEMMAPAEQSDDAEFLRRVYLDLHGVVPTAEQAAEFLADEGPDKRARLINTLLASPRYGEYLGDLWQGYLVSPLADDQRARADRFRQWLADRFNTQAWDQIATELLTATGKIEDNPAVIYLVEGRLPRSVPDLTDLTTRYFLGVRLNCAQCHDHPFVDWKQQDYWGMAAFFTQVQTPGRAKQVYQLGVRDDPKITLASLKDGAPDGFIDRPPTFLGGEKLQGDDRAHRRAFAEWMTSPHNPYFARAAVNRTWWQLFGRGIVQPVDDMHAGRAPSHPELLDLLTSQFIASAFDLKYLTRAIVLSEAYQRTSQAGDATEEQATLFGRMSVKVLSAGQLYDSLATVFGSPAKTPGIDPRLGARPEFIQFFADDGDPDPTAYRRGIPHLLRLMNSRQFAGPNVDALARRVAQKERSTDEMAGELFIAILSREPTAEEQRQFRDHLGMSDSAQAACRDLAWALMMSSEFSVNR
jgi:hypothetical protein